MGTLLHARSPARWALAGCLWALAGCGAVFPHYTAAMRPPPPGMTESGSLSRPADSVQHIRVLAAEAPPSKIEGGPWDSDGPPDLYVVIFRNDVEIYRSPVGTEGVRATFQDPGVTMYVPPGDRLRVELWDEDGAFDDVVGREELTTFPVAAMRGGNWIIRMAHGATVQLEAQPPEPLLGLGVTYEVHDGYLLVLEVVADGPAAHAGLIVGDRITRVDNRAVSEMGELGSRQAMDRGASRDVTLEVVRGDAAPQTMPVRNDAVYPARK